MTALDHVQTRIFPSVKPRESQKTPLSILDATVARFSATGAVWMFDELPEAISEAVFLETLQSSFIETLNAFPQWSGQLQWAETRLGGGHTERFNRPILVWGAEEDPGVEWNTVKLPLRIDATVPGPPERASGAGVWIATDFPQNAMLSKTPLPLHDLSTYKGLSGMTVQVSLFGDGGYAIGIKMSHMLADAQSLLVFVNLWATQSQALFGTATKPQSHMGPPVFDPAALDARAAGDIDGPVADSRLIATARALPLHRYDWWDTEAPGYSPFLVPTAEVSKPPPEQLAAAAAAAAAGAKVVQPETRAPWFTWDLSRPVGHALVHFSREELENLKAAAVQEKPKSNGTDTTPEIPISRLDALLAHLFRTINRARFGHRSRAAGEEEEEEEEEEIEVFLEVTLDVRRRVEPPLPETFIGSPLFLTHIKASVPVVKPPPSNNSNSNSNSGVIISKSLGTVARELRQTMNLFTPDKVAAMLHDAAHELSPQRLWQGFVGERHVLVTSWLRLPLYEIDFVGSSGGRPRYVHPVMPSCDGVVLVVDSAVGDGGVDVGLFLDREAMGRLLEDGGRALRRFGA